MMQEFFSHHVNVYRFVNSAEDISSSPVRLAPAFCSALRYDISAVTADTDCRCAFILAALVVYRL